MKRVVIVNDYGIADGFVGSRADFAKYLARHTENIGTIVQKLFSKKIAVLKGLNIEGEHQGKGHGKNLLGQFEYAAKEKGSSIVLLICDDSEAQRRDFDLDYFYKTNGYRRAIKTSSGYLMWKFV